MKAAKDMNINLDDPVKKGDTVLRLGGRFNAAKPLLYEVPTYLAGCPIGTLNRKTKRKKAMAMKIKELKRLIENAPDDATFSIMSCASGYEMEFLFPKRGLLIDSPNGQIFTINQMGTHWSKEWEKENYKIIGWIEKDIDNKLKFIKDEQ